MELPTDLYAEAKTRKLLFSELLEDAVRAEIERCRALDEADAYLAELIDEIGEPSPEELARAEALAGRIRARSTHRAD